MNLSVKVEIFQEEDHFVALSPELNLSSFGENIEEAKTSFKEALEAFVEECQEMKTLEEVLVEAGFTKKNLVWEQRKPVIEEKLTLSLNE